MTEESYIVHNVTKYYGKFKAIDSVSLELRQGKIIGLLGKNGAGKSTLMRCMLGFLNHSGEVYIDGNLIKRRDPKVFEKVAFIPDVSGLDDRLTVKQTIDYVKRINPKWNEVTANKLLEISNLPVNKKVSQLSKGMKTKLYLMITLSLDVNYLILDEPTLGLDIAFRKEFFNTILNEFYEGNKTIFISTHQVEEVEDILQEIVFIDKGKILLHEEVHTLKELFKIVSLPLEQSEKIMQYNPKVYTKNMGFMNAVLSSDIEIEGAIYGKANLADIFLAMVGGTNESV
ncbi:MAG TPA: ABC transporter ATP-binding protein [Candidatus Cloacimonas sp.]|nr:ABC transporter ATP-binding protein [Candidatus Cloacimonas sp.]MDD3733426.1 ABC transporter ATP-binding protein [Candidatus Cloacimonadota bacterium]MDD3869865.1 ABC transporter ATP-binding protein [Candidatus Cloacimonadota bacterium]MDD4677317.1 ABC transporter ATP-binding protein [Candidatus Cloacimonadota bacterium]HNZ33331.1 ABC transporter ATP-binding protein [Candidatus Cloacimonas sp.]